MLRKKAEEVVKELNIVDDILFQKMAEDIGFCEEVISTILGQKVIVEEVIPQNSIKNLQGRSVVLDALCRLEDGRRCNIEVQKADDDHHLKRVRYHTSCITANITEPGDKFEKVPDMIVIYISRFDMFDSGMTTYHIDRVIRETGDIADNGVEEIYINTKIDDGSDVADLMKLFKNPEAYDFKKFPNTSNRKKQFKQSEGGENGMCDAVERFAKEYAEEVKQEEAVETAKRLFASGGSLELAKTILPSLSEEILQNIWNDVEAAK